MNDFLLLIDGSSLLTTQFFGNLPRQILFAKTLEEKEAFFGKIMQTSDGFYTNAVFGFLRTVFQILKDQQPKYLAVAWDMSRNTFRREIYPDYKGNRGETLPPLSDQFAICEEALALLGIPQFLSERYEADDFCGSLAKKFEAEVPIRIMTKDNDYLQLVDDRTSLWMIHSSAEKTDELYQKYGIDKAATPAPDRCFVFTPELVKQEFGVEPVHVNSLKGIMGDSSDNIKGVPGVGEATARALIGYYGTVDALYQALDGKSAAELDALKKFWKDELGIKRSPVNYLLKESETELVGEKSARLSEELATIKKDLDFGSMTLADLRVILNREEIARVLGALEIRAIQGDVPQDYLAEAAANDDRLLVPYGFTEAEKNALFGEEAEKLMQAFRRKAEDIQLILEPVKEETKKEVVTVRDPEACDAAFGELMEGDASCCVFLFRDGLILCEKESRIWHFAEDLPEALLSEKLEALIAAKKDTLFGTVDLKEHLGLFRDISYKNLCDLGVMHYLLHPVESDHGIAAILADAEEGAAVPANGKEAVFRDEDAAALLAAMEQGMRNLKDQGMEDLYQTIEMPLVGTLYEMEKRGILVDAEKIRTYGEELQKMIEEDEQAIYQAAGETFNINSTRQLGVILFEKLHLPYGKKTKTGYSTSADVLERLRYEDPIIEKILHYRQIAKLKSTYTDGLAHWIQADGRIHSKLNQTITATGRLSSTDPNLQNIPVRVEAGKKIRKAFVPKPGYVFVDADYSQIELRIMAHMSGDEKLIAAYNSEQDIHRITASQVFHTPFDEVTAEQRRNAKAVNFGIIYGISSFGLGENLGIGRKEAEQYIADYFATYPQVKEYLDALVAFAKKEGYVTTLYGRRRPIPELVSNNYMQRQFGERVAMNSPIQGTAADIIKIAMIRVNERLKREIPDSKLLLQIHDELLVEAKEEDVEKAAAILREEMQNAASLSVPLAVDVKTGMNWYDAH